MAGCELREERQYVGAGTRVEVARRLVGKDHARLGHEGPRNGYSLLLPTGELTRQVLCALFEADFGEQRQRARAEIAVGRAAPARARPRRSQGR